MDNIYGFDTQDFFSATSALLVYVVYKSRNTSRFKVSLEMWGQIERFVKSSAKRSQNIPQFIEQLKPKLCCETLSPTWMRTGIAGHPTLVETRGEAGELTGYMEINIAEQREFLTTVVSKVTPKEVLGCLYKETSWIILLVRDRLERERPANDRFKINSSTTEDQMI